MRTTNKLRGVCDELKLAVVVGFLCCGTAFAQGHVGTRNLSPEAQPKRIALVIGNSKYPENPLKNPANDAHDMAAALRGMGFEVIEKIDAGQREMNRAISEFGQKLTGDGVSVVYYSGHGIEVEGTNFLVPVDAQISTAGSVRTEGVDLNNLLGQMSGSPLNIVILDACRTNPFERSFRAVSGGLAPVLAPKGTLIAYATAPRQTASDGTGRNGTYTQELLKLMQTPGLPVEQVFKEVRRSVQTITTNNQTPWESSSLTGDFSFKPGAPAPAPVVPIAPAPALGPNASADARQQASIEEELWREVKDSTNPGDFAAYLFAFPDGRYKQAAMARTGSRTWFTDPSKNCKLWLASASGLSVQWSGSCQDGKAHGPGQAVLTSGASRLVADERLEEGLIRGRVKSTLTDDGKKRQESDVDAYMSFDPKSAKTTGTRTDFDKDGTPAVILDGIFTEPSGQEIFLGKIRYLSPKSPWSEFQGRAVGGKIDNGKLTFRTGLVYTGNFVDNKFSGFGTATYTNGDVYEGDFVNGRRDGKGHYKWANGNEYIGEYKDNKEHGSAIYIGPDHKRMQISSVAGQRLPSNVTTEATARPAAVYPSTSVIPPACERKANSVNLWGMARADYLRKCSADMAAGIAPR